MISFTRNDNQVIVKVEHGIFPANNSYFSLEITQAFEYQAELLRRQLHNHLSSKLEAIRQEAYNQGWKDAKSKKVPKRTWFSGWW